MTEEDDLHPLDEVDALRLADEVRKREADRLYMQREATLRRWLSDAPGRELFAHILHDLCLMYRPVAVAAYDPNALHFREGGRAVGQHLHEMALLMARPQYMVMLDEALPKMQYKRQQEQ